MSLELNYEPEVFVEDIEKLTEKEWLSYRKSGLGGSDTAAVFGVSPWKTARELYYDKKGISSATVSEDNWVAKEVGHCLEELVAKVFFERTGLQPYAIRKMFRHPLYPFMLADVDYFVDLPDGRTCILECKTTSYPNKDKWGTEQQPVVPYQYELQGRHYMAVSNVDAVFFACLYDNNENSLIIRKLERDLLVEEDMIEQEKAFWEEFIIAGVEPPYTEKPDLVLSSIRKHYEAEEGIMDIPKEYQKELKTYASLKEEKRVLERKAKDLDSQMKKLIIPVVELLEGKSKGQIVMPDGLYECGYTTRRTTGIAKAELEKLHLLYPDIYNEYAKTKESQSFYFKPKK